jgi:hypothetical protein
MFGGELVSDNTAQRVEIFPSEELYVPDYSSSGSTWHGLGN